MEGLLFYADLYASWVESLSILWEGLNTNILVFADRASSGGLNQVWTIIKNFIIVSGLSDLTVLGFIFSMMGTGFAIYFAIMLIKWVTGIIT